MKIPVLFEKVEECRRAQKKRQDDDSEKEQPSYFLCQILALVHCGKGLTSNDT
jgi:hypothetical protein